MEYAVWPENGCSLAEARERTADRAAWKVWRDHFSHVARPQSGSQKSDPKVAAKEAEDRIEGDFRNQMTTRQLVAYGRPGHPDAPSRLISRDVWLTLPRIGWESSSIGEDRRAGNVFFDVRVFPALLAPCRPELIDGCALSDTFKRLVLNDPEVAALGKQAIGLATEFERVFVRGHCYVHGIDEWPVVFERRGIVGNVHPDPNKRWKFAASRKADPIEVSIAADALFHRCGVLIGLLRRGEFEAQGLPTSSDTPAMILHSIWSHCDFYFNANGDVFQVNDECEDPPRDFLKRRWVGVVLHRRNKPATTLSDGPNGEVGTIDSQTDDHHLAHDVAPFSAAEVLQAGSLSEALSQLVFRHPQVWKLRANVLALEQKERASFEESAGLIKPVFGHDDSFLPLKYVGKDEDLDLSSLPLEPLTPEEEAISAEYFDRGPPEIVAYYDAVNLHARTLFRTLQTREVNAFAHTVRGDLVRVAHTIWSHEDFYVHPLAGDIYEAGPGRMTKKWTGVIFSAPTGLLLSNPFHGKHMVPAGVRLAATEQQAKPVASRKGVGRKSAIVSAAIAKSGIDLGVCELGPKEIAGRIQNHLPNPPNTKEEWEALSKMIARLLHASKSPRS